MTPPTPDSRGPLPFSLFAFFRADPRPSINWRSSEWRRRNGAASTDLQVVFNDPVGCGYLGPWPIWLTTGVDTCGCHKSTASLISARRKVQPDRFTSLGRSFSLLWQWQLQSLFSLGSWKCDCDMNWVQWILKIVFLYIRFISCLKSIFHRTK